MSIGELRQAILRLAAVSQRHGATEEAEALRLLAEVTEPYAQSGVKAFVDQATPPKARGKRRKSQ